MNAVFIIVAILLAGLVIFDLCKLGTLESSIDDIYNKALTMQGEIEANKARSQDNYKLLAKFNTEVERVKSTIADLHKHEPTEEPAKELENELENIVPEQEKEIDDEDTTTIYARRMSFARLRQQGADVKNSGAAVGVSYSTAKRYEKWRVDNNK